MADWKSFKLEIPGKDLLEPLREALEVLLVFMEVLKAILETIKLFLIDFGNPLRALIEALIKLIEELFEALKASGLFAYFDIPGLDDPTFANFIGGFQAFTTRFKGSLFDTKDFRRPQPRAGSTKSGFVLLVVDSGSVVGMIQKILFLMRFFGKEWSLPRFNAPENFKAIPVGASGDPILRLVDTFTSLDSVGASLGPIKQIQLQWTLPSTVESADPGFSDITTKLAFEFVPPSFVIERTEEINPLATEIGLDVEGIEIDIDDFDATGLVKFERNTNFKDRKGERVKRRDILRDNNGEPFVKFQKYTVASAATLVFGSLGKFRFIDTDVEAGKTYYYRCRAFLGTLNVDDDGELLGLPSTVKDLTSPTGNAGNIPFLEWPSKDDDPVIMGKATGIISATVAPDTGDFDPFTVCVNLFKTALSLDFHQFLRSLARFDDVGFPLSESPSFTLPLEVGRGSLVGLGDAVVPIEGINIIRTIGTEVTVQEASREGPTGRSLEMPYQSVRLKFTASRLAGIVVSAMMQQQELIFQFRSLMRSPWPKGKPTTGLNLAPANNIEEGVKAFTTEDFSNVAAAFTGIGGVVDGTGIQTYVDGYDDAIFRLNVLTAINFVKSFTLGGVPPNWESIVPLRDIIPWSSQFIYDLLDKIDALLAAFSGIMDEIRDFIDLLIRKIEALEEFIQFLIDILNFIESLQLSVFLLAVSGITGGVEEWVDIIDNAGGDAPTSGPNGFSAGIALAYVAPDIAAFEAAFGLIFGPG